MTLLVNAVNLPLGVWLVFGLRLGVTGAALATLTGTVAGGGPGRGLRAAGDTRTVLVASLAGDAFLVPLAWLLGLTLSASACAPHARLGGLRPGLLRRQLVALPHR